MNENALLKLITDYAASVLPANSRLDVYDDQIAILCSGRDFIMGYTCTMQPGHEGRCWTNHKKVIFRPDVGGPSAVSESTKEPPAESQPNLTALRQQKNLTPLEYAIVHYAVFGGQAHAELAEQAAGELIRLRLPAAIIEPAASSKTDLSQRRIPGGL
ncbi:MAG: hypothetical protein IPO08_22855 [Xanthomonadales bacterium]|nr:hypothetical protein [Xanthomonadales bacterium]